MPPWARLADVRAKRGGMLFRLGEFSSEFARPIRPALWRFLASRIATLESYATFRRNDSRFMEHFPRRALVESKHRAKSISSLIPLRALFARLRVPEGSFLGGNSTSLSIPSAHGKLHGLPARFLPTPCLIITLNQTRLS